MGWFDFLNFVGGVRVYLQYGTLLVIVIALLAFIWIDNTKVRASFFDRLPNQIDLFKRSPELSFGFAIAEPSSTIPSAQSTLPSRVPRDFPTDSRPRHRNFLPPSLAPSGAFVASVPRDSSTQDPVSPRVDDPPRAKRPSAAPNESMKLFKQIQTEAVGLADQKKKADKERKKKDRDDKAAARLAREEAAKEESSKAAAPAASALNFNLAGLTKTATPALPSRTISQIGPATAAKP